MPVLEKDKEIELVITWVCQWHCEYCCVDTHNRPKLSFDEVKKKLEKVIPGYLVTLSGGEPGSLKREQIEFILNELEKKGCELSINTNGLFIKKYPDLLDRFSIILYHCSQDIDVDDEIIIDDRLEYQLIVTDNNFHKLGAFLEKHSNLTFHLVPASNPENISGPELSLENKHEMLKLYHSRMTHDSKIRIFREKNFDSIIYL